MSTAIQPPPWASLKDVLGKYHDGESQAEELIHKANRIHFEAYKDDRSFYIRASKSVAPNNVIASVKAVQEIAAVIAVQEMELRYARYGLLTLVLRGLAKNITKHQ